MKRNRLRILERIQFTLERQFVKGAQYHLLFVAIAIGLISIIGGILVMPEGEPTQSFGEAVWWAFLRLSDPGYLGDDEGTWRRIVSTLLTILGYVVFLGSMVAIITTWLNTKIRHLEQGLTPVSSNNHVIILGWTNKTIHTAGEIFQSVGRLRRFLKKYGARKLKLIILSEDVTPDHVQELKDNPLIGKRASEIILRSGIAIDKEHLRRVDSLNAAAIIIPSASGYGKEFISPDVETIKTLLTINTEVLNSKMKRKFPYIVAEIQDENKIKAAYFSYSGPIEVIGSNSIISRLLAQNIRHHGLSAIFNELLSRSLNNNIFAREYDEAKNKSIYQLRYAFPDAILLGVVRCENDHYQPLLNLADDFVVQDNDKLVLLARNSTNIESPKVIPKDESLMVKKVASLPTENQEHVQKVLILGWNYHIPSLIKELCTYEDEYYEITIITLRPIAERERELEKISELTNRVKWKHIETDFVNESELKKVSPETFDDIILVSSDKILDNEEADARTIVGYVLLEQILKDVENPPHFLLELSDSSNESLLRIYKGEVITSPLILSQLLAGIALQRELNSIYKELFTVGGAEIIFRNPEEYGIEMGEITFKKLEEKIATFGETALGYYREKGPTRNDVQLVLNPNQNSKINIKKNDRLVVLTTVY